MILQIVLGAVVQRIASDKTVCSTVGDQMCMFVAGLVCVGPFGGWMYVHVYMYVGLFDGQMCVCVCAGPIGGKYM